MIHQILYCFITFPCLFEMDADANSLQLFCAMGSWHYVSCTYMYIQFEAIPRKDTFLHGYRPSALHAGESGRLA